MSHIAQPMLFLAAVLFLTSMAGTYFSLRRLRRRQAARRQELADLRQAVSAAQAEVAALETQSGGAR